MYISHCALWRTLNARFYSDESINCFSRSKIFTRKSVYQEFCVNIWIDWIETGVLDLRAKTTVMCAKTSKKKWKMRGTHHSLCNILRWIQSLFVYSIGLRRPETKKKLVTPQRKQRKHRKHRRDTHTHIYAACRRTRVQWMSNSFNGERETEKKRANKEKCWSITIIYKYAFMYRLGNESFYSKSKYSFLCWRERKQMGDRKHCTKAR